MTSIALLAKKTRSRSVRERAVEENCSTVEISGEGKLVFDEYQRSIPSEKRTEKSIDQLDRSFNQFEQHCHQEEGETSNPNECKNKSQNWREEMFTLTLLLLLRRLFPPSTFSERSFSSINRCSSSSSSSFLVHRGLTKLLLFSLLVLINEVQTDGRNSSLPTSLQEELRQFRSDVTLLQITKITPNQSKTDPSPDTTRRDTERERETAREQFHREMEGNIH